ncbi:hypothetical protein M9H77_01757 [Catharanthus roseus]|uniref:Uncharacterized protein n=1 Tax=Catharanthus roseus TaxID=4058 RepID=A0ACC0C6L7_CATRO|nr:hypothetical protein M9H77_01757 [Catharanthus roseus]
MLLKKFFQKTIDSVKSFLSGGYQRLPKSPPCNSFPCVGGRSMELKYSTSYKELDKVYTANIQWDNDEKNTKNGIKKYDMNSAAVVSKDEDRGVSNNLIKRSKAKTEESKRRKMVYEGKKFQDLSISKGVREEKGFLVAKKLKELEMLDKTNVEHVLDIEEILHYYSRLTCPAYLDIVDSFFMEMYSELLSGKTPERVYGSWPKLQTVRF